MPIAEAFLLSVFAIVALLTLRAVQHQRRHPEQPRSPSTRLATTFILGFTAWAVANIVASIISRSG